MYSEFLLLRLSVLPQAALLRSEPFQADRGGHYYVEATDQDRNYHCGSMHLESFDEKLDSFECLVPY